MGKPRRVPATIDNGVELWRCTKCGLNKPAFEYYVDKTKRDGITSWCKTCMSRNSRERKVAIVTEREVRDEVIEGLETEIRMLRSYIQELEERYDVT
jgi:hypothetical protein